MSPCRAAHPCSSTPGLPCAARGRVRSPPSSCTSSGTRREELLLQPEILQKTRILRQFLYNMDEIESMELVLKQMKATKTNVEFFDQMRRGG